MSGPGFDETLHDFLKRACLVAAKAPDKRVLQPVTMHWTDCEVVLAVSVEVLSITALPPSPPKVH
jgi:hypothetical protein